VSMETGTETVLEPWVNEAVVFEDFHGMASHAPPPSHPVLVEILLKFLV
jgi:hypothetical protein